MKLRDWICFHFFTLRTRCAVNYNSEFLLWKSKSYGTGWFLSPEVRFRSADLVGCWCMETRPGGLEARPGTEFP